DRVAAHRHALPGAIQRHALGVVAHGCLARGVGSRRWNPDDARARRDVDDRTGAGLPHGTDGVLAAEEHAVQVGLVDRAPGLQRGVLRVVRHGLALEPGDAGIVDDDVQPAVGAQDRLRGIAPCLLVAHVQAHGARRIAKRRRDDGGAGLVDVGDVDRRAFGRERPGDRLADSTRGAGDEGYLVLKTHVVVSQASVATTTTWRRPGSRLRAGPAWAAALAVRTVAWAHCQVHARPPRRTGCGSRHTAGRARSRSGTVRTPRQPAPATPSRPRCALAGAAARTRPATAAAPPPMPGARASAAPSARRAAAIARRGTRFPPAARYRTAARSRRRAAGRPRPSPDSRRAAFRRGARRARPRPASPATPRALRRAPRATRLHATRGSRAAASRGRTAATVRPRRTPRPRPGSARSSRRWRCPAPAAAPAGSTGRTARRPTPR